MAKFSEEYICYLKQPPVENRKSVRAVLWPVYVWQVFGPDISRKRPNVFERSILSLLSKGRGSDPSRVVELSVWLGLEPDMVTFIIEQQLVPKGYISDRTWTLTKEGIEALEEQVSTSEKLRTGYVFQDAVDGGFMPRYANTLDIIEPKNSTEAYPSFSSSKGTNHSWKPLVVRHVKDSNAPDRSELSAIMDATKQAQRNAWMMGARDDYESIEQLDALDLSDKQPFPAYLWVWIYTDAWTEYPWAVTDPVGLHHDVRWMRDKVDECGQGFPGLSKVIGELLGLSEVTDFESLEKAIAARNEQARQGVITDYADADRIEGLTDLLYGWMSRKMDIETSSIENRYHDYRDLVTQSSNIIEFCASYCSRNYPLRNLKIIPYQCDTGQLRALISNLDVALTEDQIDEVVKVNASKVYHAAKNHKGSLRLCMVASLLSMPDYPHHPLWHFSRDEECFLRAYALSHQRDKTVHVDPNAGINKNNSLEAASVVASFLKIFFEGLKSGQAKTE